MAERAPTHTRKTRNNREALLETSLWEFINLFDERKVALATPAIIEVYLHACRVLGHKPAALSIGRADATTHA